MRIKHIDPIKLTILKHAILSPVFFLSIAFLVFSFSPTVAWAAAPPTPTNLTATATSSKQINLSWQDNATNEAKYYIERAPASTGSWKVIATLGANVTTYQDTGLTQNTTYYYRVRCKAGNTFSTYSNTANAKTATLAAPTALSAIVASVSSINFSWTDNTTYETKYSVERSPNGSKSWTVIATLGANVTTYTNTGLTVGTAYYYRVRAYDSTNYSAYSSVVNQTIRAIVASAGSNGAISPSGTVGEANGTTQVFTMTPNAGYKIATVTVDGGVVATNPTYTFSNITVNHTISATFAVNTFTITASAGANGSISPSGSVAVNGGANQTFTITPTTGYHVADVLVDGVPAGAVSTYTFTNVTANHTIAASFAINTYTITASAGANGTISPSGVVSVNSGATATFTIAPNAGYHISDVQVDGLSVGAVNSYIFTNVMVNHTIIASFAINTYTITATANANGTISPAGTTSVNSGTTTTCTITANTGYHIADVLVDGASVGAPNVYTFTSVAANHTITASFAQNSTNVSGAITTDTTWTLSGSPYIVTGNIWVSATLTIEPGVVVKFTNGQNLFLQIGDGGSLGRLQAVGALGAPIIFTSNKATPAPGDWAGIYIYPGSQAVSAVLDNVTVEYAGAAGGGSIYLPGGSSSISNSIIRKSSSYGINLYSSVSTTIQNNTITDNGNRGINIAGTTSVAVLGNTISNNTGYGLYDPSSRATIISGNTFTGNTSYPVRMGLTQTGYVNTYGTNGTNAVEVVGGTFTQDITIKNNNMPYIATSSISVYGSTTPATIIIEPGVTLKFGPGMLFQVGAGSSPGVLIARGTANSKITLTSSLASPTFGSWNGVYLFGDAASASIVEHVIFEYAGAGANYNNANLTLSNTSPVLRNCTIRNSAGSGIYLTSATNYPVVMDSVIMGNKWGIYASSSNPYVTNTLINGNTTAGAWNGTATSDIDARDNWWGVASGPTHTSNPMGTGDRISDRVIYNPWLGQTPAALLSITGAKALPSSLNPIGDYIAFTAAISSSATWTVTITDGNSVVVRTFAGSGTAINQKWYGEDNQAVKVPDGGYYFKIDAVDPANGSTAASPQGLVMVSRQIPIAILDAPSDNQQFSGGTTINITGTASDASDFKYYTLDSGIGENPTAWTNLITSWTSTTSGLLYAWNTATSTNSVYTLRLTVTDYAGNIATETTRVRLAWIQNVSASEAYISPNGDGVKESTLISATFNQQASWSLTIKNATGVAVRTYSGTGESLSQTWDGKDQAGQVVPDGTYTYRIDALGGSSAGPVVVDNINPTVLITSPGAQSILWNTVPVIGTAGDTNLDSYKVEFGPASGAGPWNLLSSSTSSVSNGTLASWVTNDQTNTVLLQNGGYTLRLTATDKAGNSGVAAVPVNTNNLFLSNVSINGNTLNTYAAEIRTVYFTINTQGTVTFKIVPEKQGPTGTPVYQASQTIAAAGAYSFTWDGKDSTGKVVPDEAYLYVLEASDGTKTDIYSPAASSGTSNVTCSQDTYNPYKNDTLTISYIVSQPARVDLTIAWGPSPFKVMDAVPHGPGNYTFDWDGRGPTGAILADGGVAKCAIASLLRENAIITTGDTVKVSALQTDPYEVSLSYGQFTRIRYVLSRDANVTVKLLGSASITLTESEYLAAGPHEIEWRGLDTNDATGRSVIVTGEGVYTVLVEAKNPYTGSSSQARGVLRIGY